MALSSEQIILARLHLADPGTDEVQTIQINNATGGTWTITWDGQTTTALQWDAGANDVQNALCALSNVGVGNLTVILNAGVPGSSTYVLSFTRDLAGVAQPIVTVASSLTGTGVSVVIQESTTGGVTAFSDDELNSLYAEANLNFFLMISYGFRALEANAAKFNDYVAGQTEEKKSQIERALKGLAEDYYELSRAGQQVQIVRLAQVPPRLRAVPTDNGVPATSLNFAPPFGRRWGRW